MTTDRPLEDGRATSATPRGTVAGAASSLRVIVVEDDPDMGFILQRHLVAGGHAVEVVGSAEAAVERLEQVGFDVAVCDLGLPGLDGHSLVQDLTDRRPDLAVVVVTVHQDPNLARRVVAAGAHAYLIKPVNGTELLATVAAAHRHRASSMAEQLDRQLLQQGLVTHEVELQHRAEELTRAREELLRSQAETIRRLAAAAESRDPETSRHLDRMSRYAAHLARRAGLTDIEVQRIELAAPMHDIGKIGIDDEVLLKEGPFTDQERAAMQAHPEIGHQILAGSGLELLDMAAAIALGHHERWDGSGYPNALAGQEIPIAVRIVSIADVFDALTTERRYKRAYPIAEAEAVMRADRGHFDPDLLDLFFADPDALERIRTG